MINEILQYTEFLIPVVGFCIILILGGAIWALNKIKNELKKDFVTTDSCKSCTKELKEELSKEFVIIESCQKCTQEIKDSFHRDIDKKYDKLAEQIKQNRDERMQEIKKIADSNIRLETKMDLLLKGMIKHE